MLHQTQQQVLNSLIERSKKQQQLTLIEQQQAPSIINNTNFIQTQPNTNNESQWHWQHYHLPYQFGAKTPNFDDYDEPSPPILPTKTPLLDDLIIDNNYGLKKLLKNYDHSAHLSCDSGEMILRLNFSEPFKGIVYPNHERLSPCRFFGDGHHNYELRLPLRGCGTRQVSLFFI